MSAIISRENLTEKYLFAQHPGFEKKPISNAFTREQFNIPEDAFVFTIVGVRLDTDIDSSFLELITRIAENPKAHFAFAGKFNTFDKVVEANKLLTGRITHLGFQSDIMAVYALSDAFLNPARKGGGSGIVYAMQAGLPVLSLMDGDAGLAAEGFPVLIDYDALAVRANDLIENEKILKEYQDIATKEAPKFTGRTKLIARIMDEFEKFAESKLSESA